MFISWRVQMSELNWIEHGWAAYSRHGMQWMKRRFWSGHWCFPEWCRYGYRRGGPEWLWRCVSWKNLSEVQRLLVVQYLESSCGNFGINLMANREPVQAGQNWHDVAVPRLLCNEIEQGCSEPSKGEQDLMQTCLQEENYNSRAKSRLLPRLLFLLLQWSGMNKCGAEPECGNMMPYKSRKHAYWKTYVNSLLFWKESRLIVGAK